MNKVQLLEDGSLDSNLDLQKLRVITKLNGNIKFRDETGKAQWANILIPQKLLDLLPPDISKEMIFLLYSEPIFFNDNVSPKIAFLDIETNFRGKNTPDERIICATICIDSHYYFYGEPMNEKEIVQHVLFDHDFDLLTGWNLENFDWEKITNAAKKYHLNIPHIITVDYDQIIRGTIGREFVSFKLEDVAQELLGYGKTNLEGKYPVELPQDKLKEYNMNDVQLMVDIETKYKALASKIKIQEIAHCFLEDVFHSSRYHTYLILREIIKRANDMGVDLNGRSL
jgi:DNA polymerase elongation subunit (family B)